MVASDCAHAASYGSWIVEDAAISFAYAKNIAAGHGPLAQPGTVAVEGFSNALWVLLLAALERVALFDIVWTPKVVAGAMVCTALAVMWRTTARDGPAAAIAGSLACLATALNPALVIWTTSGLENGMLVLFAVVMFSMLRRVLADGASLERAVGAGALGAATAFVRPDAALWCAAWPVAAWLGTPDTLSARRAAGAFAATAASLGALGTWLRFRTFGDVVPSTFHVNRRRTRPRFSPRSCSSPGLCSRWPRSGAASTRGARRGASPSSSSWRRRSSGSWHRRRRGRCSAARSGGSSCRERGSDRLVTVALADPVDACGGGRCRHRGPRSTVRCRGTGWASTASRRRSSRSHCSRRSASPRTGVASSEGAGGSSARSPQGDCCRTTSFAGVAFAASRRCRSPSSRPTTRCSNGTAGCSAEPAACSPRMSGRPRLYSSRRIHDLGGLCEPVIGRTLYRDPGRLADHVYGQLRPDFLRLNGDIAVRCGLQQDPRFRRDYVAIRERSIERAPGATLGHFVRKERLVRGEVLDALRAIAAR